TGRLVGATFNRGNGGALADGGAVVVPSPAVLVLTAAGETAAGETVGSLAGTGTVQMPGTLTTGGSNASTTFSGTLGVTGDPGKLFKQGGGTFTVSGTGNYRGVTAVVAGTLLVDGSIAPAGSPGVSVLTGGTLGGTGTTGTVESAGTVAPG